MTSLRPRYTIDTIYYLDPKQLKKVGIRAVFNDLNNALFAWSKTDTAAEMDQLNYRLTKAGIRLVIISNDNAERIGKVLNLYHISFIAKARKPLPIGINQELKELNLQKDQVLIVGDQLTTDMQASNLAGVATVLVRSLVEIDKWSTRISRFLEKFIFFFLNLRKPIVFKEKLE